MTYSFNLRILTISFIVIPLLALFPSASQGQTRPYTNNNLDYALDLPSAKWRVTEVSGVAHSSTEFRYGDQVPYI